MAGVGGGVPEAMAGDNHLKVARVDETVVVQVFGLGNMFLAPTLQAFIESEIASGHLSFIIDLNHCTGLDSTFMGTILCLSKLTGRKYGWFCLVNVADENRRLLKMLGVINMVSIHDGDFPVTPGKMTVLLPTTDVYARQKQIHGAHRFLMDADPANQERFGPFIKALEEEMSQVPKILPPQPSPKRKKDNGSEAKS
ncbi:MAG: STAS domain-containing protein [Planctomycetota bacterium]|jgi:anti-anti-sigma factor|nr:STAS domain-containing protein [Planctomycetota bacterium]